MWGDFLITLKMADENDFIISAVLDNENFKLHFTWNEDFHWLMDIRDNSNNDLVRGIKVVPNFPLLKQYRRISSDLPRGEILVAVVNQSQSENQLIPRDGFTSKVFSLIYVSRDEYNEIMETDL